MCFKGIEIQFFYICKITKIKILSKGGIMLGRLNEIENRVLDTLQKLEVMDLDELRRVLGNLNYAVDSAKIGICQWDYKRGIRLANSQFHQNFNTEPSSPESAQTVFNETFFPEDLEKASELEKKLYNREIEYFTIDMRQRSGNRTKWWRHIITIKDHTEDSDALFTAVIWEITAEKESIAKLQRREKELEVLNQKLNHTLLQVEQKQKEILDAYSLLELALHDSHAYVWNWDLRKGLVQIDFPILKNQRIPGESVCTIDKLLERIYPEDITHIQMDKLAQFDKGTPFSLDLRVDYAGQGFNWFEFRGHVIECDAMGVPVRLQGIAVDIQKRKDQEISGYQLNEKAMQAERQKRTLIANMANELRIPLHAIMGFSETLAKSEDKEERMKYLEGIKHNNGVLLQLIDGVRECTQEESEWEELNESKVSLWEYMVELQQIYSMKVQNGVRLIFANSYDDLKVIVDKEKLGLILDYLLMNAIKHTTSGQIRYRYELKNDKLVFVVSDTGNALSEYQLQTLFNRFDLAGKNDERIADLPLCKGLVERMQGDMHAESNPTGGTTFTITFPLNMEKDEVKEPLPFYETEEVRSDLPTILVAEDIVYSYMMMKTLLEDRFNVIHAENGQRAIELFETHTPDFIFMDIKMPVMDGLEATREIRKRSADVPIVVLTAYAVRSLKKEAADAGCSDMLTKPTTTKQINAMIRKHMKNK